MLNAKIIGTFFKKQKIYIDIISYKCVCSKKHSFETWTGLAGQSG